MTQPNRILIECPKDDLSFFEKIKEESDVTIISTSNFQGSLELIEVVISLTASVIPLITTFLTENSKSKSKRKVIINGEKRVFENYKAEEVAQILKKLNE